MPSKQVVDSHRSATSVVAVAETHADAIAEKLTTTLRPHLAAGETMPDIGLFIRLLGRHLKSSAEAMVERDRQHDDELRDDSAPREARDAAAGRLYGKLVEQREVLAGMFGSALLPKISLEGPTPQVPAMLSRFASSVADGLRKVKFPEPRVKGVKLEAGTLASEIDGLRTSLDTSLEAVAREEREAQGTLSARDEAVVSYQRAFSHVANGLRVLLEMVSMDDLAAKVRPSQNRPGRTEDEQDPAVPTPTV